MQAYWGLHMACSPAWNILPLSYPQSTLNSLTSFKTLLKYDLLKRSTLTTHLKSQFPSPCPALFFSLALITILHPVAKM